MLLLGGALVLWRRADDDSRRSSLPEGFAGLVLAAFVARAVMGDVTYPLAARVTLAIAAAGSAALVWSLSTRSRAFTGQRFVGAAIIGLAALGAWGRPPDGWTWLAVAVALVGLLLALAHQEELAVDARPTVDTAPEGESGAVASPPERDGDSRGVLLGAAVLTLVGLLSAVTRVLAAAFATEADTSVTPSRLLVTAAVLTVLVVGLAIVLHVWEAKAYPTPPGWVVLIVGFAAVGPVLALLTLVPVETLAADIGRRAGPFAVLLATLAWLTASFGVVRLVVLSREQANLFHHLRFRRMPVIGLALTWIVLVVVVGAPLERIDATSHQVRTIETTRATVTTPRCPDSQALAAVRRHTSKEQLARELCRWITSARSGAQSPDGPRQVLPLVLVTASGGGVRAAAWTMRVLDCLLFAADAAAETTTTHASVATDGCPARPPEDGDENEDEDEDDRWKYLFAAGGASGGSVGIASAVAARLYPVPARDADGRTLEPWARAVPGAEHVGGLATQMVAELGLAALGPVTEHDRAEELIDSWAAPYGPPDLDACPGLPRTVGRLGFLQASTSCPGHVPLMLFNGTIVRTGTRFDISPLDRPSTQENDPVGLRDVLCGTDLDELGRAHQSGPVHDVALFDAAFLSARFPFVTPSGRLGQDRPATCETDVSSPVDVLDGGYHDNSGAAQVARLYDELLPLLEDLAEEASLPLITPILVRIENGERGVPKADDGPADRLERCSKGTRTADDGERDLAFHLGEPLRVPWAGYPNYLLGQGCSKVVEDLVRRVRSEGDLVVEMGLYPHPGRALPLGWSLTGDVLDDMNKVMDLTANANAIAAFTDCAGRADEASTEPASRTARCQAKADGDGS